LLVTSISLWYVDTCELAQGFPYRALYARTTEIRGNFSRQFLGVVGSASASKTRFGGHHDALLPGLLSGFLPSRRSAALVALASAIAVVTIITTR
jgi:hypothetical protein